MNGAAGALVEHIVRLQAALDGDAHHFLNVRHADEGKTLRLEHVDEARQHSGHVVAEVVLQVVGAVNGVVLGGEHAGQLACIAQQIRLAGGVYVQQQMLVAVKKWAAGQWLWSCRRRSEL